MSKKDNQIAAEIARSLHHLRRMQGRLCWDTEGLWLVKGEIDTDHEDYYKAYNCVDEARPSYQTIYELLMQPEKRQLTRGTLSQWQFHLRSLPPPKEFEALAATGTPPLRKYRNKDAATYFQELQSRHGGLQYALDAWDSFHRAIADGRPAPLKSLAALYSMGLCIEPSTDHAVPLPEAPSHDLKGLLDALAEEAPASVSAMALSLLAVHRWRPDDEDGWPQELPSHWQRWWEAIHQAFRPGPQLHHLYALWLLICQTPQTPAPTGLKQLAATHSQCHKACGPVSGWMAVWGSHRFGWEVWKAQVKPYLELASVQLHSESDRRFEEFLEVLHAVSRQDAPSGRFEDIELHEKLLALEGTHTEKARSMVDLLIEWLEHRPHPLDRPGAARHMARDIAHQLHRDDWHGMRHSLTRRWRSLLQAQDTERASTQEENLQTARSKARAAAYTCWSRYEESRQPALRRKKKRKRRQDNVAYDPYEPGYHDDSQPGPEPPAFAPRLSPPLDGLMEAPAPSEVPLDPFGWAEWLWHRAWHYPPGTRAMVLQEIIRMDMVSQYQPAARLALWQYEPLLAVESVRYPDHKAFALMASQGDLSFLEYALESEALDLWHLFEIACNRCSLSADNAREIHKKLTYAISKNAAPYERGDTIYDALPSPPAMAYCEPDEILDFVEAVVSWQQLKITQEYNPVEHWYNQHKDTWWRSVLRTGDTRSIHRLLASDHEHLHEWGVEAATRVRVKGSEERLRKLLRKARDAELMKQERLALALGRQGQPEDAWKLLVLLKKNPQSIPLLVAVERCGHPEHTQAAYELWQPPHHIESLITPHQFELALESRCPAIPAMLLAELHQSMDQVARGNNHSTPGLSRFLWLLSSKPELAPQCQEAIERIADVLPQWCSHAVREAFADLQGLHQTLLDASIVLDTQPESWSALIEWISIWTELADHSKHISIPACIDDSIWRYLWNGTGIYGLEEVLQAKMKWGIELAIALALRHRLPELPSELRAEIARRLFASGAYTTGGFQLAVEFALSTADPQAFCDQHLSMDLTREPGWEALWMAMETPDSPDGRFLQCLRRRHHFYESPDRFFLSGIDVIQTWLPPERALPHIQTLLQEYQVALGREDETDGSLWASLLVPLLTESGYGTGEYLMPGEIWSYRVAAMLIQEYLAECPDFDKEMWLDALDLLEPLDEEEDEMMPLRTRWLLGQIHAYLS